MSVSVGTAVLGCVLLLAPTLQAQAQRDSTRREAPRIAVTAEHLRSAFRDSLARDILNGARVARLQQDSALMSYDARGFQRISVGLGFGVLSRERLAYRREGATRVKWKRDVGAVVEVEGARAVTPIVADKSGEGNINQSARRDILSGAIQLPDFPGSEQLWLGSDIAKTDIDPSSLIHPLASGAEAYYRYATGDSAEYTLPDGKKFRLVEMLITPREPKWNLVVGSFWFDLANYRLVRAIYRLAVPLDVWTIELDEDDKGVGTALVRALINPMRGSVSSITVEYGLYESRFWLPRIRTAEGYAQVSVARVPFELQQRYDYLSVNGPVDIAAIPVTAAMAREDSVLMRDSLAALDDPAAKERATQITEKLAVRVSRDSQPSTEELRRRASEGDSAARAQLRIRIDERRTAVCDTAASETRYSRTENRSVRIMTTATCNDSLLVHSPHLPLSILAPADELFRIQDQDAMLERLHMGLQSQFSPQVPRLKYGLGGGYLRYNRIEGLSPALEVQQQLGAGLSLSVLGRMGTADREFNGHFSIARDDGRRTMQLTGYRRLIAANDWGNPLGGGASFLALVFGVDEGFYYRGTGAEFVLSATNGNPFVEWKLYGERQRNAEVNAKFSIANALGDREFGSNIVAEEGDIFGSAARIQFSLGLNPDGFRILTTLKAENGIGDFSFGRAMFDATFSHGIMRKASMALTLSAGSSVGHLPVQRSFLLGGTQSVRGQRSGTLSGNAFWMSRIELGNASVAARRVLFADFGWAGSREDWKKQSRAISGVGLGWSFLDGLIRMDIARGIYPSKAWRFASYLEARY